MKTKTNRRSIRSTKASRQPRKLHKRILLHPLSVLVLLCFGVLLVGATLRTHADTYDVTATVPAPLPTDPAVITSYNDQEHVSSASASVSGTCPDQSYVKLFINNTLAGVSSCTSGTFVVNTTLTPGTNVLQARVYNITNNEGPASPPITIYYDATTSPPPVPSADTPTELDIQLLDGVSYLDGNLIVTSTYPTISGLAPPFSKVTLTFHSNPITCSTQAGKNGRWTCTIPTALTPGIHSVDAEAITPDGKTLKFPRFYILVVADHPSLLKPIIPTPLTVTSDYQYQAKYPGELWSFELTIAGGTPPYSLDVTWGDNKTTNETNVKSPITLTHSFTSSGVFHPFFHIVDKSGQSASFQTLVVSKTVRADSLFTSSLDDIRSYLWIIWPTYIVIALMVISFWLGEYEIMTKVTHKKPLRRRR